MAKESDEQMDNEGYVEIKADDVEETPQEDMAEEEPEEAAEKPVKKEAKPEHRLVKKHVEIRKHVEKKEHEEHRKPEEHSGHQKKRLKLKPIFTIVLVIAILFLLWNVYSLMAAQKIAKDTLTKANFEKVPALIQITKVVDTGCKNCFSLTTVLGTIKGNNVNVTKEEQVAFNSTAGAALIKKYSISKIPAVIVTGDTARTTTLENSLKSIMDKTGDAYVFTKPTAPYTNLNGTVAGLVSAKLLGESSCTQCGNSTSLMNSIKQLGVVINDQETVWASSLKGKGLIAKYNITVVPVIVLSPEIEAYDSSLKQKLLTVFSAAKDGAMVQKVTPAPYYDLATGTVKGLADLTLVVDRTCTECYNVSVHEQILTNPAGYNLKLASKKTLDVNDAEGKALVNKYKITSVPTFILSSEASAYASLVSVWPQVGTVETDGSYVFRQMGVMNVVYKNLTSGELVQPAAAAAGQ